MFYPISIPTHAIDSAQVRADRLRLVAWSLLAWSLLYALPHLYWGLGGGEAHSVYKPSASQEETWEAAHLFAFVLMTFAGLLGFALERLRDAPTWRFLLLSIVGGGAAIAASHGLYGIAFRAASVAGITDVEGVPFDAGEHGWVLWDLFAIEPWFLIEGLLLGLAGYFALTSMRERRVWLSVVPAVFLVFLATAALSVRVA